MLKFQIFADQRKHLLIFKSDRILLIVSDMYLNFTLYQFSLLSTFYFLSTQDQMACPLYYILDKLGHLLGDKPLKGKINAYDQKVLSPT